MREANVATKAVIPRELAQDVGQEDAHRGSPERGPDAFADEVAHRRYVESLIGYRHAFAVDLAWTRRR